MTNDPVTLVTGAGSGIGRETARLLAEAGHHVALVARTESALDRTAADIRGGAGPAPDPCVLPADVADPEQVRACVAGTVERFGRLDAVANVAGFGPMVALKDVTTEIWRRCVDVNLSSIVHMTAAAWPHLARSRAAVIVNVSSMAAFDPFPGLSIYAAAKVAVNLLTLCTAREGDGVGIRAVAVAPGAVETPMLRGLFSPEDLPPEKTLDPAVVAATIRDCITGRRAFEPGETIAMPSP